MTQGPKIAVCAARYAGYEVMSFIRDYPFPIDFAVTSHQDQSEYEKRISDICHDGDIECFRGIDVNDGDFVRLLREREIDLVVLAWWPSIVSKEAIEAVNIGWVNMHPSLLPYGRGKHPYYWSIVENNPFGVTLHFINERIDEGDILIQKEISVSISDTGETLYKKAVEANIRLFKDFYPKMVALQIKPVAQSAAQATFHWAKDIDEHSRIDLGKDYKALDLINIIRGRTFIHGDSAFFMHGGKKFLIKAIIEEVDQ